MEPRSPAPNSTVTDRIMLDLSLVNNKCNDKDFELSFQLVGSYRIDEIGVSMPRSSLFLFHIGTVSVDDVLSSRPSK